MIDTSAEYQSAVDANTRNWSGKVQIDYTDYNLDNTIVAYQNNLDRLSDDLQIANGKESPSYKWWSWSNFEWGQHLRSESSTNKEKGALSQRISDPNNGSFPIHSAIGFGHKGFGYKGFSPHRDYPKFIVSFLPRTVSSIRIAFDDKLQEYPETFDVNIYVGSTINTTENVTSNSTVLYTKTLSSPVLLATSIEIVVKDWNVNASKAKIMEAFTSVSETYEDDEIINITIHEEVDPVQSGTPIGNITSNTCNVTLMNIDSKFDNDNEESILSGNVIKNRRVKPSFILNKLINDEIQGGEYYTTQWNVDNNNLTAELTAQDVLGLMGEAKYTESQFITPAADQDITYTTTSDFNGFSLDNIYVGTDEIIFQGGALDCGLETTGSQVGFDHKGFGYFGFNNGQYCGEAIKTVTYTYTPGTTVNLSLSYNGVESINSVFKWFVSYTTVDNYEEIEDISEGFSFLPEDPTNTSQTLKFKLLMITSNVNDNISVQDISITISEKITLLSLAALVIESYDNLSSLIEGNYLIDQLFGEQEIPAAYITPKTYKDALRLICEAGAGRGYVDRTGGIILEAIKQLTTASKTYTNSNMFELQKITNPQTIFNRITVNINTLEQAASSEEIGKIGIEIANGEVQTSTVRYNSDKIPADTITTSGLPSGVTITDQTDYVWGSVIELTNASGSNQDFDLTINGKPYTVNGSKRLTQDNTESIRLNGVIEYVIDNPLIQTEAQAQAVIDIMTANFGVQKKEANADVLSDPSLELGDTVSLDSSFYLVNSQDFTLSSGLLSHQIGGKR